METDFPGFYEKHDKEHVTKSMIKYIHEKQEMDKVEFITFQRPIHTFLLFYVSTCHQN